MRFILLIVTLLCGLASLGIDSAEAAKKKPTVASPPKPIYLAPMRVVIVRNSDPKCEPKCPQWIAAEGEIMTSTPQAFRKVFKDMGKEKLPIIIRSPGGSIEAALEIGRMIRARGLTVAVGQTEFKSCSPADKTCKLPKANKGIYEGQISETYAFCNSACPMLLSGGTTRLISRQTSAGVHQPSTTWTREFVRYREYYKIIKGKKKITSRKILGRKNVYEKTTYGLSARLRKKLATYYKSMGVDLAILDETEKAKFQDMNYLSQDQTDKLKLRTTALTSIYLSAPSLCGSTPTSAVCVLDKSRDPALVVGRMLAEAGVTSMTPEMTFRLAHLQGSDCQTSCPAWIAAEGVITSKTAEVFKNFMKAAKAENLTVVLNSQGGDLRAAIALGEEIKSHSLDTSIAQTVFEPESSPAIDQSRPRNAIIRENGICQGACVLALMGGQNRDIAKGAKVTLHNPAVYEKIAGSFTAIIDMNWYLRKRGVAPTFMASLHEIKRNKPKQFQNSELLTFAVATGVRNIGELYKADLCKPAKPTRGCFYPETKAEDITAKSEIGNAKATPVMKPILAMSPKDLCKNTCPVWIYGEGKITAQTLEDFKKLFSEFNSKKLPVILNSTEGDLNVSLALGYLFREHDVEVAIAKLTLPTCENCGLRLGSQNIVPATIDQSGVCGGSCVIALAGGTTRISFSTTPLYLDSIESFKAANIQDWKLKFYFKQMGMQSSLIERIRSVEQGKTHGVLGKDQTLLGLINSGKLPTWLSRNDSCDREANCVSY